MEYAQPGQESTTSSECEHIVTTQREGVRKSVHPTETCLPIFAINLFCSTCLNQLFFLFKYFLLQGSRDNMSIIIIAFPGAPKPTDEAMANDRRLDKQIEKIARGCFKCILCF